MNEKKWSEMAKFIKAISESIKGCIEPHGGAVDEDTPLMAMQVLSILCSLNRGYTKEKISKIWAASLDAAQKIHEFRTTDKVVSQFQIFAGFENRNKN
jgi:hypothetical protein